MERRVWATSTRCESATPSSGSSSRCRAPSSGRVMLRIAEEAFRSDVGRQRSANEDSYFASSPLFAVADGLGGAQAGEVASRIAAESFDPDARMDTSPERYLRTIAERANERIHRLPQAGATRAGMGATLAA